MRKVYVVFNVCFLLMLLASIGSAAVDTVADAAEKGDLSRVRSLLEQKADVNRQQADETTALHWAVRQDNLEMVNLLIGAGAKVTAANRYGVTPLSLACVNGNASTIEALLKAGADANVSLSDLGETPLMLVARTGKADAVNMILSQGVDVNARENTKGHTALMWAAVEGHSAIVRLLVEHGAEVNAPSRFQLAAAQSFGRAPAAPKGPEPGSPEDQAYQAILSTNQPDLKLPLLLNFEKQFAESKLLPSVYEDMLRLYEARNDYQSVGGVVDRIRPREKQLGRQLSGGISALMLAARENHLETVRVLADSGAELNSRMATGTTALLMAVLNGRFELAEYLLDQGADPNLADKDGKAPLYAAVEMRDYWFTDTPLPEVNKTGAVHLIQALLEHGANPNIQITGRPTFRGGAYRGWLNEVGATPFYRAASSDDIEVMRLLLAHGADPTITASDKTTPLMVASGIGFVLDTAFTWPEKDAMEALLLCLELNDVNAVNDAGLTALHGASFRGWNAAIEVLVKRGARLDVQDKDGHTPLAWADGLYRGGGIAPVTNFETVALLKQLAQ